MVKFLVSSMIYMNYFYKYLKYKKKYINLRKQLRDIEKGMPKQTPSDANNIFTINLYENLDGASNIISPLSISIALSLINLIIFGDINQLTNILGYKYNVDILEYLYKLFNSDIMKMTNVLIINKMVNFNKEYWDKIKNITSIFNDDFSNPKSIVHKVNSLIEYETNGIIKNIIQEEIIKYDIKFILINTVYFKANWKNKFEVEYTSKMRFHKTDDNYVNMMHQINDFNYYENSSVQIIELPYNEKDYVMGIILSRNYLEGDNLNYSINNVPHFSKQEINSFINNLQYTNINLYLPKFTHRKCYDLNIVLEKMGLNMMTNGNYASKIIHEVVVIVDEFDMDDTIVTKTFCGTKGKSILFKADHAFIYYIRQLSSNFFLFIGDYQGNKN